MDDRRFDALAKFLSGAPSRRGLLAALLAALGVAGEAAAKPKAERGREHGRNRGNGHGNGRNRKGKRCNPKPKSEVCAGKCGRQEDNCGKRVDCGPCRCDQGCPDCQRCDERTGLCVADAAADGTCCDGGSGVCGGGACDPCAGGQRCEAGTCVCDAASCPGGCCDGDGSCQPGDTTAVCGSAGGACAACGAGQACCGNACLDGSACCADDGDCGDCESCQGGACRPDPTLEHACAGPCPTGQWCDAGACAAIADTVRLPDCGSLCNGQTAVCGQTVTCPSCSLCRNQTGCSFNDLPDGPRGSGTYCSLSDAFGGDCTSNADCAAGRYCSAPSTGNQCSTICPF